MAIKKVSKTEVDHQALQHELERGRAASSLVDLGVDFCRKLRSRADAVQAQPVEKAFIDGLYEPKEVSSTLPP